MAVSIDYGGTNIIDIPKADLTLVSGTLYELDTNAFRLELKSLEDDVMGMAFPKTHTHNTTVTVAGTTFSRTIEILSPYSVRFEAGSYSVRLAGSNNNIFDVGSGILVQNTVQVIAQNSAGLIQIASGSGLSTAQDTKLTNINSQLTLIEGTEDHVGAMRLILSALQGVLTGAATTTIRTKSLDGLKNRLTLTVDADGNRSVVVRDSS